MRSYKHYFSSTSFLSLITALVYCKQIARNFAEMDTAAVKNHWNADIYKERELRFSHTSTAARTRTSRISRSPVGRVAQSRCHFDIRFKLVVRDSAQIAFFKQQFSTPIFEHHLEFLMNFMSIV